MELTFGTEDFDTVPAPPKPGAITLPQGTYQLTMNGDFLVCVPAGARVTIEKVIGTASLSGPAASQPSG